MSPCSASSCMAVRNTTILAAGPHVHIPKQKLDIQKKGIQQSPSGLVATADETSCPVKGDEYYCEKDLSKTIETLITLSEGCFYFPEVSSAEAKHMLKTNSVGTFFVRDSSDSRYLYTVSVKTVRGPTSIRISYSHGRFALDSDEKSRHQIPKFTSLLDLIDYYIRISRGKKSEQCRFLDKFGKKELPIIMTEPKRSGVPSLKHLCRTAINRTLPANCAQEIRSAVNELTVLPKPLRNYLKDYPYLY